MQKFYQISTDKYLPLSFENQYLHKRYDQIANVLSSRFFEKDYRDVLAEPIHNGSLIEWYSPFQNLQDVRENKTLTDHGYQKYHAFLDDLKKKINEYASSKDPDKIEWANILTQVFKPSDNVVFSNGEDISIIWGWKFDNREIYKPRIIQLPGEGGNPGIDKEGTGDEVKGGSDHKDEEEDETSGSTGEGVPVGTPVGQPPKKKGFIEFLRRFASNNTWLLVLLLVLTALVFTLKSLKYG